MRGSKLSWLAIGWVLTTGALCGLDPAPESFTDDPGNRASAERVAHEYLVTHRAELLGESAGVASGSTVNGGRLRGTSGRAFEVRLSIAGDAAVTQVIVYVYDDEGLAVAGAQTRDAYGAVGRSIGGHLDRSFVSRD